MLRPLPLALLLAPLAAPLSAQDDTSYSDGHLTIRLEGLEGFEGGPAGSDGQVRARWRGELEGSEVRIQLFVLPSEQFGFDDPWDVVEFVEDDRVRDDEKAKRPPFAFDERRPMEGAYGFISYAWLGLDTTREDTKPVGSFLCLGGLLPDAGYSVEITCEPALNDAGREAIETFLAKGIRYEGETADTQWSDEEIEARWQDQAPEKVLEDSQLRVVRSKHYVIMTNVGKGTARSFGKKIDECYERIREVYPFEDIEGQKLLPIFYFVTPEQYYRWYSKNTGKSLEQARRSGGVSFGDVYSTYHQATNAPVHIHEATHQVFKNRLHLGGGGSWLQEGVAEYMSVEANELGHVKSLAKREKHVPLQKFFTLQSLLHSAEEGRKTGGSEAGDNYTQAAALIEFLRHGKHKDKFQDFVHAMGRVPRGHLPSIERELQRVLGVDAAGLDADFVEYWMKRKKPRKK